MSYLKKTLILGGIIVAGAFFVWTKKKPHLPIIAITQIVEHPSLDAERLSCIQSLKKMGYIDGKNIKILYQNAQGSTTTATQIAKHFASNNVSVLVAISTPSAQAAKIACAKTKIPVVFSAVTDPVSARLVPSLTGKRSALITGITDRVQLKQQVELIKTFLPNCKKLGFFYSSSEVGSSIMLEEMLKLCVDSNIELIPVSCSKISDVQSMFLSFISKVDAVYVPLDNMIVSSMSSIAPLSIKHNLPIFASDDGSIAQGALAASCFDRKKLGEKLANIVVKILKDKTPANEIEIGTSHEQLPVINKNTMTKMGIFLPKDIEKKAHFLNEKDNEPLSSKDALKN